MTNWLLVAVGVGIVGIGVLMFRAAERIASFHRRFYERSRSLRFMAEAATTEMINVVAGGTCVLGALVIVMGLFLADQM